MKITPELIKIAFRKLKSSVYFDKTVLPLRDKVVKFETSPNFKYIFEEIAEICNCTSQNEDSSIISEILNSISVLPFPKNLEDSSIDENTNVISVGGPKEIPSISDLQYFIDMDVRGHILGVLWIMIYGKKLDNDCYKNSFGNRLRKPLIWDEESENIINTPTLFEPYFGQYSRWRDDALSCAESILKKEHNALILTLDLKRFYYNTGITKEEFNNIYINDSIGNEQLHSIIFSILEKYTRILKNKDSNILEHGGNALPIGFLPSAVLSNWCLSKFDKGILDYWNPSYYGRYVDDVIIVEKFEKKSEIYQKVCDNNLSSDFIIDYYLGGIRNKNK